MPMEPPDPGPWTPRERRAGRRLFAVLAVGLIAWVAWLSGRESRTPQPPVLTIAAFSVMDAAMTERLLPAFRERWHASTGEHVEFVTAFAGSGAITDGIHRSVRPQVAILSSEMDARRLLRGPLRRPTWHALPYRGVLCRTPIVIQVVGGNPDGIHDVLDLRTDALALLHVDPSTSGLGALAVLAVFGAADRAEDGHASAVAVWRNVVEVPAEAREARRRFASGATDAWLTYEQCVLPTPDHPERRAEVVRPRRTLLAEPIVVRLDPNVDARHAALVDAFLAFLWTEEAQGILETYGFRPVLEGRPSARDDLPVLENTFTLEDLGGAEAARRTVEAIVPPDYLRVPGP